MYKNIHLLFLLKEIVGEERERERERERELGTAKVYTKLRYDISLEPYFFALPPQG